MEEFRINKFITLKLENGATVIYVNNEEFMQCKALLINIPVEDRFITEDLNSIDDAAEVLIWSDNNETVMEYKLSPELEFWGHCSNIQTWVEHDYDTKLMHSNLAFPLLKKLADAGDPKAKKNFKLEILRRFIEGSKITKEFLDENGYLDYLTEQDVRSALPVEEVITLETLEEALKIKFQYAKYLEAVEPGDWVDNYYYIEDYKIVGLKIRVPNMDTIPKAIGKLNNLKYLYLANNTLKFLPDSVADLENLESLYLYYNQLEEFPESFKKLKNLRYLDLSDNKLKGIPLFIKHLNFLEVLNLSNNQLEFIPDSFKNLRQLRNLDLSYNKLKNIPSVLLEIDSLQDLNIESNPIDYYPVKFGRLKRRDELNRYNKKN
ncbi:MAG: leucine-rich repeat domain-containing protein [Candidatus Odinarchaeota archaeon]